MLLQHLLSDSLQRFGRERLMEIYGNHVVGKYPHILFKYLQSGTGGGSEGMALADAIADKTPIDILFYSDDARSFPVGRFRAAVSFTDRRRGEQMKIVVLDGYTLNPGDLSWSRLESIGNLTVYDSLHDEAVRGGA